MTLGLQDVISVNIEDNMRWGERKILKFRLGVVMIRSWFGDCSLNPHADPKETFGPLDTAHLDLLFLARCFSGHWLFVITKTVLSNLISQLTWAI